MKSRDGPQTFHERGLVTVRLMFQTWIMLPPRDPDQILKARGAAHRPAGRFEPYRTLREPDGWDSPPDETLLRRITALPA